MTAKTRLAKSVLLGKNNVSSICWRELFSMRSLGFALNRAWVYLLFMGMATSSITWSGQPVPGIVFSTSTLVLFASLIAFAFASKTAHAILIKPGVRYLGPLFTSLGTILVASTTIPGTPQLAISLSAGLLTGIGSGIIDMGYGMLYRGVNSKQTCLEVPLAFLLSAVLFFLIEDLTSSAVSCVLSSLLPLISGFILFIHYNVWSPQEEFLYTPVAVSSKHLALRVGVCSCLVGAADSCVRAVFMAASEVVSTEFYHVPLVIASLFTVLLIWGCVLFSRDFNLRGIYKIAVLIMAFFFQLLPIFVGTPFEHTLALTGYGTFNALVWILLADITHTYQLNPFKVFGIGWGMLTLGVFIGSLIGELLCNLLMPFTPQVLSSVALVSTIAVLLSYMFVLKESDIVELTAPVESVTLTAELPEQNPLEQTPEVSSASAEIPADQDNVLSDFISQDDDAQDSPLKRRFVNRCNEIAQKYGLSDRETQIMIMYAKGRSYARIQEELFISRGTLTTHLRHIYQKMNVHNKQEFLDLIEQRNNE